MSNSDNNQVGYSREDWERHYNEEDLRWDLNEAAPPLVLLWQEKKFSPCKVIVPGCGAGHEVLFLAKKGFNVTAVDYSHGAIKLIKSTFEKNNYSGEVLHQDFFELDCKYNESFELMVEHTFFCAINPNMRQRYVETAKRILKPGGYLIGLFYETNEDGGPPFNTRKEDIETCFSSSFMIESLSKTPHSAEQRLEKEWLAVLKKKDPEDE
jgi:methyl halide transferase